MKLRPVIAFALPCLLATRAADAQQVEADERGAPADARAVQAELADAERLMAEQRFAAACPTLERLATLRPHDSHAKVALADCYLGLRRLGAVMALPLGVEPPAPGPGAPTSLAAPRGDAAPRSDAPTAWPALRVAGLVTLGLGVGATIAGTAAAASGIATTNAAADAYGAARSRGDTAAMATATADHDAGTRRAAAGWATVGVGAAALVTGITLAALPARDEGEGAASAPLVLRPWLAGAAGGLVLGGSW